jgi:thiol-disulfide isomerase/thioredoxin
MKHTIFTVLLALVAVAGQAQIKCHVVVKIMTEKYGDDVVICKEGTDLRFNDTPFIHYRALTKQLSCDIESDHIEMYEVVLPRQMEEGSWFTARFLLEEGTVMIEMYADKAPKIQSTGMEGRLHQTLDSLECVRFWNDVNSLDHELETNMEKYFMPDFVSAEQILRKSDADNLPKEYLDSVRNVLNSFYEDEHKGYNEEGWALWQQRNSIAREALPFRIEYYAEHPMLWAYYDVLSAYERLKYAKIYTDFNPAPYEQMIKLYDKKICKLYKGHPIHQQIAMAKTAYNLQQGKPYIDYTVRNTDGKQVPISSLIKGKVALIDLWASWCGSCRKHSKAMIPIYEKYQDKGFTVLAIAREQQAKDMKNAMEHDKYPWPSLLELNDENRIWEKNGAGNAGGAMFLIDRDGTILSTSTDAEELEPLIKKALNIEQ